MMGTLAFGGAPHLEVLAMQLQKESPLALSDNKVPLLGLRVHITREVNRAKTRPLNALGSQAALVSHLADSAHHHTIRLARGLRGAQRAWFLVTWRVWELWPGLAAAPVPLLRGADGWIASGTAGGDIGLGAGRFAEHQNG